MLTGLSASGFARLLARLTGKASEHPSARPGRPHALDLSDRVLACLIYLRTGLSTRQLAALFAISQSAAQRLIAELTPRLAELAPASRPARGPWVLDGTLIPTQDHSRAAISKNYRYSVNVQLLAHIKTRRVIAVSRAWPGNRNDITIAKATMPKTLSDLPGRTLADGGYRSLPFVTLPPKHDLPALHQHRSKRAVIEHIIAHLKNWQVLRNCRRKHDAIDQTINAVIALYNYAYTSGQRGKKQLRLTS